MYDWGDHNCLDRIKAYTQPGFHKIIWIICIQSSPPPPPPPPCPPQKNYKQIEEMEMIQTNT